MISRKHRFSLLAVLLSFVFTSMAFAHAPGFYLGANVGLTNASYKTTSLSNGVRAASVRTTGVGYNLFVGYDIFSYFGGEFGIAYFAKPKFNNIPGDAASFRRIKNNIVYFVGRGVLDLGHHFSAVAKLGGGYIVRDGIVVNNVTLLRGNEIPTLVYGAGLQYVVRQHWLLDVMWMGAPPQSHWRLPCSNFVGVGFGYHFG